MKNCLIARRIRFFGSQLVPPYCKKVEPIYNDVGDTIGQTDVLDYECFRSISIHNFRGVYETACIDTLDEGTLIECVNPNGLAIYEKNGDLYHGFCEECLGVFTDEGVWTKSDLFVSNKRSSSHPRLTGYGVNSPQLGAKCQKSMPKKVVFFIEEIDSALCNNMAPCARHSIITCE